MSVAKPSFLVAEDDATFRAALVQALRHSGFSAEGAGSVDDVRRGIATPGLDLVLLDLHMPDGSTDRLTGTLDAMRLPFIVMSGHWTETDAWAQKGRAVLRKPFSFEALMSLTWRQLGLRLC